MQVSMESAEGLTRRLRVQLPAERIDEKVDERLKKLTGRVKLDGFRPGKVPFKVVKSRFGGQVRQEVLNEELQSSFYEAVSGEQLSPAGMPDIEELNDKPGQPVEYVASFEVYPEIEVPNLSGLSLTRPQVEIAEADVDAVIERLRQQQRTFAPVERAVSQGDRVIIDFEGRVDGEIFEGGQGEEVQVDLGGGGLIPGFEEQLEGIQAGESREIEVTFPEQYGMQQLAGRDATFSVTCKRVEAAQLPEVNEDFAKALGAEDGTVEGLRKDVRDNMQRELDQQLRSTMKRRVMDALLEAGQPEVPQALLKQESQRLLEQGKQRLQSQGVENPSLEPHMFEDEARRRVALGLMLAELIKQRELKADPEAVRQMVEEVASQYQDPEEVIEWYYADQSRLGEVESVVLEDRIVDLVTEEAQVTDEPVSFQAFMNPSAEQAGADEGK